MSNIKKFNAENKLRQATLTFMVTQLSNKIEENRLRKSFNQFDINGDGKIDLQEFIAAYKVVYPHIGHEDVENEATEFFKIADQDGSGFLDYQEFSVATFNQRTLLNENNIKLAFEMFDRDSSGNVEVAEIA